jgi:hypothetical protein
VRRITAVVLAAAFGAAACSTPGGTARDPSYFEGLRTPAVAVTSAIAEVGSVFEAAYETRANRTTRLTDLRAGTDLAIAADRVSRLEPGSVYLEDHDRYLAMIAEVRSLYTAFDGAVAGGNVASAAAAATAMESAAGRGFVSLSPEYCAEVTFDMRLCDPPPSGGGYPAALHAAAAQLTAAYTPLLRPTPAALIGDEPAQYAALAGPGAAALLREVADGLAAATPSVGLEVDHSILLAGLEAAAAAHESGVEPGEIRRALCEVAAGLSGEATTLTSAFFGDDDLECGGRD